MLPSAPSRGRRRRQRGLGGRRKDEVASAGLGVLNVHRAFRYCRARRPTARLDRPAGRYASSGRFTCSKFWLKRPRSSSSQRLRQRWRIRKRSQQVAAQLGDLRQGGRELRAHAIQLGAQVGDVRQDAGELGRARCGGGHPRQLARMVAGQQAAVGQDPETNPGLGASLAQAPLQGRRARRVDGGGGRGHGGATAELVQTS